MRNEQQDLWQAALILRHYKVIAVKGHSVFACSYNFLSVTPHNWPVHFQSWQSDSGTNAGHLTGKCHPLSSALGTPGAPH